MMTAYAMQACTLACMLPFTRGSIPGVNDNMRASVYAYFGKAAIVRPRAPPPGRQASQAREKLGWGPLLQLQQPPPEGMDPRAGATPPHGGTKKKWPTYVQRDTRKALVKETAHHCTPPLPLPQGSCCDCNKNPPPRQICFVSRRILHHEPGSCYCLRQAPASSLNFAMFR